MPKSARLRTSDVLSLYDLIGECRDLGDDPVAWREHLFAGLCGLTSASIGMGGEMGGCRAGPPRDLGTADWGWANGFDRQGWLKSLAAVRNGSVNLILTGISPDWSKRTERVCLGEMTSQIRSGIGMTITKHATPRPGST